MKENEVLIDNYETGQAVAIMKEGVLKDFFIDPPKDIGFYPHGTILIAKVLRKVSSIGGYFLKLPNKKNGFLPSRSLYEVNQNLVVCSKPVFEKDKPQRFSDKIKIEFDKFIICKGKGKIFFSRKITESKVKNRIAFEIERLIGLHPNLSVIVRSKAISEDITKLKLDFETAIKQYSDAISSKERLKVLNPGPTALQQASWRYDFKKFKVSEGNEVFERRGIWEYLRCIDREIIEVTKKSYLLVRQTSAFFSIDVNRGDEFSLTAFEINLRACQIISDLLKIHGIGGQIVIDFLSCSSESKKKLHHYLKASLNDFENFTLYGWTKMGNFELNISRYKTPLSFVYN